MTTQDGPISIPPTHRIEELFVAMFDADDTLDDLSIVAASNRDALVPPLHCFVKCNSAAPVLSVGQNYRAEVIIVVASNIDDNDHASRKAWFTAVLASLTKREPGSSATAAFDSHLIHWSIDEMTEVSVGQNAGDLIRLSVAAFVAG